MIPARDCPDLETWAHGYADMVSHVATLTRLASEAQNVLELGVRGGVSTWAILDGLPDSGSLLSVDIDPEAEALVPDRVASDPRWTLHIADDLAMPWPVADLVVIDTSHEYEHTSAELRLAAGTGARVIVLHDYALPAVEDAAWGFVRRHGWGLEVEASDWGLAVLRCP